jgi:hypothetical protein
MTKHLGSRQAVVAVEGNWLQAIQSCELTIYHLPSANFRIQDEGAGYWVCEKSVIPQATTTITNCLAALTERRIEVRILSELWALRDAILASTLQFSFIRMRNAQARNVLNSASSYSAKYLSIFEINISTHWSKFTFE